MNGVQCRQHAIDLGLIVVVDLFLLRERFPGGGGV